MYGSGEASVRSDGEIVSRRRYSSLTVPLKTQKQLIAAVVIKSVVAVGVQSEDSVMAKGGSSVRYLDALGDRLR